HDENRHEFADRSRTLTRCVRPDAAARRELAEGSLPKRSCETGSCRGEAPPGATREVPGEPKRNPRSLRGHPRVHRRAEALVRAEPSRRELFVCRSRHDRAQTLSAARPFSGLCKGEAILVWHASSW